MRTVLAIGLLLTSGSHCLALETQTQSMSFEDCLATIRRVSGQFATAPINIVETDILRVVRFPTTDGSVLVSCSRPDRKLIVTKSR